MHNKDIFCITVSLISGAQLSKTQNFDVLPDGGFGFRMQFVPIPRIKRETLEKPVVIGSKTYFFGFDPERLSRVAETAKRDLEEEIRSEIARLNTMSRKMASDWSNVAKNVTQEMRLINADSGASLPDTEPPQSSHDVKSETVRVSIAAEPNASPAPTEQPPVQRVAQAAPKGKTVLLYSVHLAAARGTSNPKIEASGYYGTVKDLQSGKIAEYCGSGDCATVARAELIALKTVLEEYSFPAASPTQECIISIYTPTEYLANMFNNRLLKHYSENGWKKKDGKQPKNLDLIMRIWEKAKQFAVKGVVISPEDEEHSNCVKCSQDAGAKYYRTVYKLIGPGGK